MFGGESITVSFKAKRSIVNQILDWSMVMWNLVM